MPNYDNVRIVPGDGKLIDVYPDDAIIPIKPALEEEKEKGSDVIPNISMVHVFDAENVGSGKDVFKATEKDLNSTTLKFRSLVPGNNIEITQLNDELVIDLSDTFVFPDINNLTGLLSVPKGGTGKNELTNKAILIGNGQSPITELMPDEDKFLFYKNGNYEWVDIPEVEIPEYTFTSKSSILKIKETGTFDKDIEFSIDTKMININTLGSILGVNKGGTGMHYVGQPGQYLKSNGNVLVYDFIDLSEITGIATVATTGDYNDLINKPVIEVGVTSFEIQSPNQTIKVVDGVVTDTGIIKIDVDESKLDLQNLHGIISIDNGGTGLQTIGTDNTFLFSDGVKLGYKELSFSDITNLSVVANTGDYNDLINKPVIPSGTVTLINVVSNSNELTILNGSVSQAGTINIEFDSTKIDLNLLTGELPVIHGGTGLNHIGADKSVLMSDGNTLYYKTLEISDLSDSSVVARTGDYNDLINKPVINSGTVSSVGLSSSSPSIIVTGNTVTDAGSFNLTFDPSAVMITSFSGNLPVHKGGTGLNNIQPNDIIIGNTNNTVKLLTPKNGILKFNGTIDWFDEKKGLYKTYEEGNNSSNIGDIFAIPKEDNDIGLVVYEKTQSGTVEITSLLSSNYNFAFKQDGANEIVFDSNFNYDDNTIGRAIIHKRIGTNFRHIEYGHIDETVSNSIIINGNGNIFGDSDSSLIGNGDINNITGSNSTIVNANNSDILGDYNFIGVGEYNSIEGVESIIISGKENKINGNQSFIISGRENTINSDFSFINNGSHNTINTSSDGSCIISGDNNNITGEKSIIIGNNNNINADDVIVVGDFNETEVGNVLMIGSFGKARIKNGITKSIDFHEKNGDTQSTTVIVKALSTGGCDDTDLFRYDLQDESTVFVKGIVVARIKNQEYRHSIGFNIEAVYTCDDGITNLVSYKVTGSSEEFEFEPFHIVFTNSLNEMVIQVKSPLGDTVRWVGNLEIMEVVF